MTVLCGTDFTEAGGRAVETAALLAAQLSQPLRLVHVFDLPGAEEIVREPTVDEPTRIRLHVQAELRNLEAKLASEAARVATPGGASTTAVLFGNPDEAVVAEGERLAAKLIVVGAIGRRTGPLWHLGSTADRIAQSSPRPVLVVRKPAGIAEWARGERPLRILVGVDATPASDAAVSGLAILRAAGPCTLIGVHVYWPPEVRERLKLGGMPIGTGNSAVDAAISIDLRAHLARLPGGAAIELVIVGGLGRVADHVAEMAEQERADLVVVGSHQRAGLDRLWHGSVSRGVIDAAPVSVLSVPSS